mmetsp:Transcript_69117/g.186240  ORF Transcript_69117/g.186240 Transcript_69117/m.186240 type:complete len:218 (-) Transcript_69117:913-1566(-)
MCNRPANVSKLASVEAHAKLSATSRLKASMVATCTKMGLALATDAARPSAGGTSPANASAVNSWRCCQTSTLPLMPAPTTSVLEALTAVTRPNTSPPSKASILCAPCSGSFRSGQKAKIPWFTPPTTMPSAVFWLGAEARRQQQATGCWPGSCTSDCWAPVAESNNKTPRESTTANTPSWVGHTPQKASPIIPDKTICHNGFQDESATSKSQTVMAP